MRRSTWWIRLAGWTSICLAMAAASVAGLSLFYCVNITNVLFLSAGRLKLTTTTFRPDTTIERIPDIYSMQERCRSLFSLPEFDGQMGFVVIPLWLIVLFFLASGGAMLLAAMRHRVPAGSCECGYCLFGLASKRCPECGRRIGEHGLTGDQLIADRTSGSRARELE